MKRLPLTGFLMLVSLAAAAETTVIGAVALDPQFGTPAALDIGMTTVVQWHATPVIYKAQNLIDATEKNYGGAASGAEPGAATVMRVERLRAARGGPGSGQRIFVTPDAAAPQVLQGFGKVTKVRRR